MRHKHTVMLRMRDLHDGGMDMDVTFYVLAESEREAVALAAGNAARLFDALVVLRKGYEPTVSRIEP